MPSDLTSRFVRELDDLSRADPINALPCLLSDWLKDESWVAAASATPSNERRAWLAAIGNDAFDRNSGGYASYLREMTTDIEHIWSADEFEEIIRRHTQWLFVNLSDILDFHHAPAQIEWDDVTVNGEANMREALRAGRGVMSLSVHQSHPGFGFLHPAFAGLGISAVSHLGDRSAPHTSLILEGVCDRVELLPTTAAALRPMLSRLAGGGCVAMYCDYLYPDNPGLLSALLGGPVLVASAAVSVALRTGAAVIPVSVARCWPPESGGVQVHFGGPLPLQNLDARDPASRDAAALSFGIAMECMIRRTPSVWRLWAALGDRWRRADAELTSLG